RLSDRVGRKLVLVVGWLFALPAPFLLIWAPTWNWILIANAFLGVSQGLTWSTTVIMKIDLVGPTRRGLAMGLNEFAGYVAVALSALATGYIASQSGLRPEPFYLGIGYSVIGLLLSLVLVKETHHHVAHETKVHAEAPTQRVGQREIFLKTSFTDKNLSSVTQAGFVNNLNDGMAWGLFPVVFAMAGLGLERIGWLAAIYPATWGILQLWTGHLSDQLGRKWMIAAGMWVQAVGIAITALSDSFGWFALGGILLGAGTAMVYPTLLAAIGDVAHHSWRASAVGVYRLWRDSGYAVGALVAGITADLFGINAAIWLVGLITLLSGAVVALRMQETLNMRDSQRSGPKTSTSALELCTLMSEGSVGVLDVRSLSEFTEGHVEGAQHLPIDGLPHSAQVLAKNTKIVTVCNKGGGRSEMAANLLREHGWGNTSWLQGGYFEWRDLDLARVESRKHGHN
ncbi:MAG: MFS transporter, partial [Bdellovibrionota bacterium]